MPTRRLRRKVIAWLSLIFGFSILGALITYFDIEKVLEYLRSVHVVVICQVIGILLITTLLGAKAAHLIVEQGGANITFQRFLRIYWISWAAGLLVPGQIGDIASNTALLAREGFNWKQAVKYLVVDKLITLSVVVVFSAWGIQQLGLMHVDDWVLFFESKLHVISIGGFATLILGYFFRHRIAAICISYRETLSTFLLSGNSVGMAIVKNYLLTIVKIGLTSFAYWLVLNSAGDSLANPILFMALIMASSLAAYIPISFSGIGTTELLGSLLITEIGITGDLLISVYLIMRVLTWLVAAIPAMMLLAPVIVKR